VQGLLVGGALRFADSDQKNFSAHDSANELAGDGLFEFFAALRRNELSFERYYATLPLSRPWPRCARRSRRRSGSSRTKAASIARCRAWPGQSA